MGFPFLLAAHSATAQVNEGSHLVKTELPFKVDRIAEFAYPWRLARLPDGRMLVTEKGGNLYLAGADGSKEEVQGVPVVYSGGQGGLLGVFTSPSFDRDRRIYLTYSEPAKDGEGSGLALARAEFDQGRVALKNLRVIWRDPVKGKGGQFGGAIAFAPDGKSLFLSTGDRQRFRPAQDIGQAAGKILRLTLDGRPAKGNPWADRAASRNIALIDPPQNSALAGTAPVVENVRLAGPNRSPAEVWSVGHRTPYGLAFAPDGNLWELEHGPEGGDELNLIRRGANYGWPLVSYGVNYDGVPIPAPHTRPDLSGPVIYWTPVIAPGGFTFYDGDLFAGWKGSAFATGLGSMSLIRLSVQGETASVADVWSLNFRVRDVAQAANGKLWLIEDSEKGGLYVLSPE